MMRSLREGKYDRLKRLSIVLFLVLISGGVVFGWDFSKHNIPLEEIHSGGPPKDGIPALTSPRFITSDKASFLSSDDRVLGFFENGEARAYPIRILNWHEIVNDIVGGRHVVITYCPLTGSGIAFDASINGKRGIFGVSGNLYNSNVLLYDRATESLWSQLRMEAVTGKMTGTKLNPLPLLNTTWQDCKKRYPDTKVLSLNTGHTRDYNRDPYMGYQKINQIYFPLSNTSEALPAKDWVSGVIINGKARAYPFGVLEKVSSPLSDQIDGETITVHFDKEEKHAWIESQKGEIVPSVQVYWFAWYAFYPNTRIFLSMK